jgi:hypothetical protein
MGDHHIHAETTGGECGTAGHNAGKYAQGPKEYRMDEYLKQALEIIKAQASVRTMTEEEISSMMRSIALLTCPIRLYHPQC